MILVEILGQDSSIYRREWLPVQRKNRYDYRQLIPVFIFGVYYV